jgi:hypothetical protein
MRALVAILLAGCWTGRAAPEEPKNPDSPPSWFEITMQRTPCLGRCPVYTVSIDGDGRVRWNGEQNVLAIGKRRTTVPQRRITEIMQELEGARFDTLDAHGQAPDPGPVCEQDQVSITCSLSRTITICSDTTVAIITVRRGKTTHEVSNDHCARSRLDRLEALIDDVAHTNVWIGERVTN